MVNAAQEPEDNTLKNQISWGTRIISSIAGLYLIFSLASPIFLEEERSPRKIETPDIILIALILIFNSNLINRIADIGFTKDGGFTAKFNELKNEINQQKEEIDELQQKQIEELEKQQRRLEEIQTQTYSLLISTTDHEKIKDLDKHTQDNTQYMFKASNRAGNELRHLRGLGLISMKGCSMSDVIRASDGGQQRIDLTQYVEVTEFGKKYLSTYNLFKEKADNPPPKIEAA